MTTNNDVAQPATIGDYACNFCDWKSTDTSRPLSRGTKVGCPVCEREARFVGTHPLVFRTTKEAMDYATRNRIPTVIAVDVAQPAGAGVELKPCPFCGSATIFSGVNNETQKWTVSCYDCPISIAAFDKGRVLAAWNTRTPPPDVQQRARRAVGVSLRISTCGACPYVDHSGAFTPGGAQTICGHRDAVDTFAARVEDDDRHHWRHRVVQRDAAPPSQCPLRVADIIAREFGGGPVGENNAQKTVDIDSEQR